MAIPFDWDIFAKRVGEAGRGAAASIEQRGLNKRAEERALRMHKERLKIEEPFKDLASERILGRQKDIESERIELQKGLIEWQGKLNRGLDIFAGSEGWKKVIEKARKDGGLSQTAIMQMEDVIMRLRRGDVPEDRDMAVFEALDAFDRLPIMDLFKQNKMYRDKAQRADRELDIENNKLQGILANREAIDLNREQLMAQRFMNMKRNIITDVEKAEKNFSEYRSELFNDLEEKGIINAKGEVGAKWFGMEKGSLIDPNTGMVDEEIKDRLLKKYSRYRHRFERLEVLRKAKEQRSRAVEEFFGGASADKPITEDEYTVGEVYEFPDPDDNFKIKSMVYKGNGKFVKVKK